MLTTESSKHREDDRLVLVMAYTDPVRAKEHFDVRYKKWILNRPSVIDDSLVIALDFNEETGYLKIDLDNGDMIVKYRPEMLIYKPYATARALFFEQEGL